MCRSGLSLRGSLRLADADFESKNPKSRAEMIESFSPEKSTTNSVVTQPGEVTAGFGTCARLR